MASLRLLGIFILTISLTVVSGQTAQQLKPSYDGLLFTSPSQNIDKKYLQPIDLLDGGYDHKEPGDYLCARDCMKYPQPRLCYYTLFLEQYHAMGPACLNCPQNITDCYAPQCITADGVERSLLSVNRRMPGTAMMACLGDHLVFDVINGMPGRSVAVHSHGMYQSRSQYMDGVPHVTQCSIDDHQTFRYNFTADTCGTMFYHSHSVFQMLDGIQGPLIIRCNETKSYRSLYDYDMFSHTMMIQDWIHFISDVKYPGYNKYKPLVGLLPDSYLINGRGRYNGTNKNTDTPLTVFEVCKGSRYRVRVIGGVHTTAPAVLSVEGHTLTLMSVDSQPIKPIKIGSLMLFSGERYDVVIKANQKLGSYWIQVKGLVEDANISQLAILKYLNTNCSQTGLPTTPTTDSNLPFKTPIANDVTSGCDPNNASVICADKFQSRSPVPDIMLKPEPDYRLIVNSNFNRYTVEELFESGTYDRFYLPAGGPSLGSAPFTDDYNNTSNIFTPYPILTQNDPISYNLRCTENCFSSYCECLHLYQVKKDKILEIIVIDASDAGFYHPHHIHGYHTRLMHVSGDPFDPDVYKNLFNGTNKLSPLKDTVAVPSRGYAIMRIWTTNPGAWLFHCHFTAHNHNGMMFILQIGDKNDPAQPPPGFPKCGNYLPPVTMKEVMNEQKNTVLSLQNDYPELHLNLELNV